MSSYPGRGIHGAAVDGLAQQIINGDLAPGTVLDPRELEREYDASRTVIREALRVLSAKGLVDARPKRGTFIRPREDWNLLDPDVLHWQYEQRDDTGFLQNLAEVRAIVEPAGVRLAARRRTEDELATMQECLEESAAADASVDVIVAADLRFHRALLFATHNELLQRMELVIETGLRARDLLVHGQESWADSLPAHRRVLDAVETGDEAAAEAAMNALLDQANRDVAGLGRGTGETA